MPKLVCLPSEEGPAADDSYPYSPTCTGLRIFHMGTLNIIQ